MASAAGLPIKALIASAIRREVVKSGLRKAQAQGRFGVDCVGDFTLHQATVRDSADRRDPAGD